MVFLVVKFMYVDLNEVVPDWWTTKDNYCYWPPKDHQEKVLKGELLRTSWAKYAIKKNSTHRKYFSLSFEFAIVLIFI